MTQHILTRYRVYKAEEGSCPSFCGEYDTYDEAAAVAESEPAGLSKSLWGTAYAAGHAAGQFAPDRRGEEDDEPSSWHGTRGWHCVVPVRYTSPLA